MMSKYKKRYVLPGLQINNSHEPVVDWILNRYKIAETRTNARLDDYMGEWIGIIETGKKKARLVGFAKVAHHSMSTMSYEEFHSPYYQTAHRIECGSFYDMKPGKRKYVYWLEDITPIEPVELPSSTFNGDRTFRELFNFVRNNQEKIKII